MRFDGPLPQGRVEPVPEVGDPRRARVAAAQFEALVLRQLLSVVRQSTPVLGQGEGQLVMRMADQALSEHLAAAGGLGLSSLVEEALRTHGQEAPAAGEHGAVAGPIRFAPAPRRVLARYAALGDPPPVRGARAAGATGHLQQTAATLLLAGAQRWGQAGALGPADLQSDFSTGGGLAHFNVRDASGYAGHYKCNLFALEVARRAGFQVPVVARDQGWGYPSSDAVTEGAAEGRLSWGQRVTGASAEALSRAIAEGERGFLLAGSGDRQRPGHMAVVERVHRIVYDGNGRVVEVEFDGWEARTAAAEYLPHRIWTAGRRQAGPGARTGLQQIEIIALFPTAPGQRPERPLDERAPRSFLDGFASRSARQRPNHRPEDDL